jgi:polar amino acid transport system substrate-binding protein
MIPSVNRASAALIALIALVFVCVAGFAAESAPGTNAPLRVGISPVFPPMAFKQGTELAGVEVDLARALGERLGRKVVFVELAWKDQIEALNEGRIDIIMSSMSVTLPRQHMVNFTQPYFVTGQMALVRREDRNKYVLGIPSRPDGGIGVIKSTTGEYLVERDFPNAKRKAYTDGAEAAKELKKKKIGMFITDSTHAWHLAGRFANDGLTVVPLVLTEEPLAWAVRKSDDALLEAANAFIADSMKNGFLHKVFRRWTAVGD